MQVKEKNNIWVSLLVLATILLGLGIQLGLGYAAQRRSEARAEALARELGARAAAQADSVNSRWAQSVAEGRRVMLGQPQQRKLAWEALHLELLILVNPWNPLPEGYEPTLETVIGEYEMDSRCAEALWQMVNDCREAGGAAYICSAYRTQETQEKLYANKIQRVIAEGVAPADAPAVAAQAVAVPGTSEHQLGLAADIIDENYPYLNEWQEQTATQRWLMENAWRYGFILRYPNGTTAITGIIYEPWHYRYVGQTYAREIYELGLTLEEYVQQRRGR